MDSAKRRCDTAEAASGLPDDPLVEILSRVPAKSLCRFKCVSKGWRDLIADPLHHKKMPQTLEGFFFMLEFHEYHGESGCDDGDGDGEEKGDEDDDEDGEEDGDGDGEEKGDEDGDGDGEEKGDEDGDEDGEEKGDDSDEEKLPRYGFVDLLHRSVRLVDFSYLTELPGIKNYSLVHCCNGLLLFAVKRSWGSSLSYVVCNPATKQCVAVPSSGLQHHEIFDLSADTYLLFDPASAPCHFNLVEFSSEGDVKVYSSKTQAWSDTKPDPRCCSHATAYFNGMLHLISFLNDDITVLDVEGNIQKTIPLPCQTGREKWTTSDSIRLSQGRLHYISMETPDDDEVYGDGCACTESSFRGILIWVLEDYERQQWVLKDTVSFSKLFGETNVDKGIDFDYNVLGIHPDCSMVFLLQYWDQKLISYHMDTKEVRDLCTLEHGFECMTPHVPCFSELALEN